MDDSVITTASSSDSTVTEIPITQREMNNNPLLTDSQITEASSDILKDSDSSKDSKDSTTNDDELPLKAAAAAVADTGVTTTTTTKDGNTSHANCVKDENGFTYYKCRFCGLTYNFLTTLKAHERVHDIETPYVCNKCGESFHYMCELEYHAKSHVDQKGYKCECKRTFYNYTDFIYHKHPEDEPDQFALPEPEPRIIKYSFSRPAFNPEDFPAPDYAIKGYEPKHPLRVYSDVRMKPYICQYCSKSYSDSRQLAYHMSSHRGERIFNPRASRYLMCRNENSYLSPGANI
jgi:DNA-directed RNA polymerase subunit RPC12/RpoP